MDYLEFLHQQLISKAISPEYLLRLNGAEFLAKFIDIPVVYDFIQSCLNIIQEDFSSLSESKMLLYFLLLSLCEYHHPNRIPQLSSFFSQNTTLIAKIKTELQNKITPLKYETVYWDQVKESYLI